MTPEKQHDLSVVMPSISGLVSSAPPDHKYWRNIKEIICYTAQQPHITVIIVKIVSTVVRLLRGFNKTEFPHDLTSRPGFATACYASNITSNSNTYCPQRSVIQLVYVPEG
jgi:hypothetical protein